MNGITAGELRLTGGPGFSRILDFSMWEYPGEHSRAELTGTMEASEGGTSGFPWLAENSPVEIHVDGMERALYSGIIQKAESREENGYCLLRLELCSGSILLDLKKEKRSFQEVSMTCGQIIRKAAAESGMTLLCPEELDREPVGFPVIQYRETDWEFIRRLASRHGLPVYPEPTMGGGKLCVGLPETGTARPMSCLSYTARMDRKFYQAGGEQEGRERRQYRTCEVRSLDLFRVGDLAEWDGKQLPVCAREARMQGGHLEFTYVLADRSWTWQRRLGNPKISGMSLLGTVKRCAGETVQLELDIDSGRPGQPCYPWTWVPTTGNLMYMMPQAGTRVSLYFKGDEEESALAVNCIRSGAGCREADPLDKSLTTEHGMQMRLCRCDMGVVTLKEKVLLDDLTGIRMEGSGGLHIVADGEVKLEGQEVNLNGNRGVTIYEGKAVLDLEKLLDTEEGALLPEVTVTAAGKVELTTEEGENTVQNRGEKVTYYLAWEHADLSHPSNRYRDEPEQKNYDWAQWRLNIAAGMVVVGSVTILGAVVAGAAAGAGMIAAGNISAGSAASSVGGAVFLTGSLYVAEQAVSDAVSGRLGDTEKYVRKALAGSVVGFLTGASGLMMQGASLGKVLSLGFGEGFLGSTAAQGLLNEDGEINWALAIGDGMFSAVMAGLVCGHSGDDSQSLDSNNSQNLFDDMNPEDQKRFLAWERAKANGITPDNPDAYVRFGFLIDNGVDYDNAYFLATLDRNIYESFSEDEIVKLINNVEEFALTLSNKKRYPAVAGVYNRHTGEIFYATNLKTPNIPQLAPQLEEYFDNMPLDVLRSYDNMSVGAGTHAEIIALNDALNSDPTASIDDFLIYVMHGNKNQYGLPFERCPHCQWITQKFYSIYK